MKKLLMLLAISWLSNCTIAQEDVFPFKGTYDLLSNEKVFYEFNAVLFEEKSLKLFMNNNIYRCYDLSSIEGKGHFVITQTFPMLPKENLEAGTLKVKAEFSENGLLHVLVNGPGTHTEHYMKKRD